MSKRRGLKGWDTRSFFLSVFFTFFILFVSLQTTAAQEAAINEVISIVESLGKHLWSSAMITMAITILAIGIMQRTSRSSTNQLLNQMDTRHSKTIENISRENRKMTSEMLNLSQDENLYLSLAEVYATIKAHELFAENKKVEFLNILLEGQDEANRVAEYFTRMRGNKALQVILRSMTAEDIMTQHVISIKPEKTILQLCEKINNRKHTGYPVVDDNDYLIGIVTFKDILTSNIPEEDWDKTSVDVIMTRDVISCREDEDALVVFDYLLDQGFGRIPIVDKDNQLVGIVSRKDFPRLLKPILYPKPP